MRRATGADPRSARRTGWTGWASCTCAGSARPGTGGRCPLRAGPSGVSACMRSRRRPAPDQATARSAMRQSRAGQIGQAKEQAMRHATPGRPPRTVSALSPPTRAWVRWGTATAVTGMLAGVIGFALIHAGCQAGRRRTASGPGAGSDAPARYAAALLAVLGAVLWRRSSPCSPAWSPRAPPAGVAARVPGRVRDHPDHGGHRRIVRADLRCAPAGKRRRRLVALGGRALGLTFWASGGARRSCSRSPGCWACGRPGCPRPGCRPWAGCRPRRTCWCCSRWPSAAPSRRTGSSPGYVPLTTSSGSRPG